MAFPEKSVKVPVKVLKITLIPFCALKSVERQLTAMKIFAF